MKIYFPNIQIPESKTLCQLVMIDVVSHLKERIDKKELNIQLKSIDYNLMWIEIEGDFDSEEVFKEYLNWISLESVVRYPTTKKLIKRSGKMDFAKKGKKSNKKIQNIFFDNTSESFSKDDQLFAGYLEYLETISSSTKITECNFIQNDNIVGQPCKVCGLLNGKQADVTERITLTADKCWKPFGQYEQLKACKRCYTLGIIADLRIDWRVNVIGKSFKEKYVIVPDLKMPIGQQPISSMNEVINRLEIIKGFRKRTIGHISTDFIFNSLRNQPLITKMIVDEKIDLFVFPQSGTGKGGFTTDTMFSADKIRNIAKMINIIDQHLPRFNWKANSSSRNNCEIKLSNAVYSFCQGNTNSKSEAWRILLSEPKFGFDFEDILILRNACFGGSDMLKKKYFWDPETIKEMNDFEWDNPLVRISVLLVTELANKAHSENKDPKQQITSTRAIFNNISTKEKEKAVREFVRKITQKGENYLFNKIENPEEVISQFIKALNSRNTSELREIGQNMEMFYNSYKFKPKEIKEKIALDTFKELNIKIKNKIEEAK